jgi:hypothetical protein
MANDVLLATNLSENATNVIGKVSDAAGSAPPTQWMIIVGCSFGGLTLLFLMFLVLKDKPIEKDKKFLIVSIIAFGLALAGGFLGSSGTLSGNLPFPEALKNPLAFGITGGAAVFAAVWIIGYWLFVRPPSIPPVSRGINYPKGTNLYQAIKLAAQLVDCTVVFRPSEDPFKERIVAEGQLSAGTIPELVDLLQKHLAQGNKPIKYSTTKPNNQNLITVDCTDR